MPEVIEIMPLGLKHVRAAGVNASRADNGEIDAWRKKIRRSRRQGVSIPVSVEAALRHDTRIIENPYSSIMSKCIDDFFGMISP